MTGGPRVHRLGRAVGGLTVDGVVPPHVAAVLHRDAVLPVRRSTRHFSIDGVSAIAASAMSFSGTTLPRRQRRRR
jgi:hypothetical protein